MRALVTKHLVALGNALVALPFDETRKDALTDLTTTIGGLTAKYGERMTQDLVGMFKQLLAQTNSFNLSQLTAIWQQVLGIPYIDTPGMLRLINGLQKQNLSLITSLTKFAVGELKKVLVEHRGKPTKVLARAIEEEIGVTASKASLLARDQVLKLHGQLTENRHKEAGITRYEWNTSGDERVRPEHRALDGRVFDWSKPPIVSLDGRHEHPGGDYQCRCVAIPIFDKDNLV